jgi:hypothetical protein
MKIEAETACLILKAGSMQARLFAPVLLTIKWGELAACIYAQGRSRTLRPDNRAAMVEA